MTAEARPGETAVIDLNDVRQPPPRHDLDEIRRRLADTARDWLPALFPEARLSPDGKTLRSADLSGRAPRKEGSCVIHLEGRFAGWGFDHATGERAGPIDLIYHGAGLSDARLFEEAARLARLDRPAPRRASERKPDCSYEVARILGCCQPVAGSLAGTYLESRGIADPCCEDLTFCSDLTDHETRRGWPGLVGVVRDSAGRPTGGIHRTYLLDDGSGKAPPARKMLGPVAGGSIRLSPVGDDGRIGLAEGIETALSATAIFGVPCWAALSADGLKRWQWPDGIRHVIIFADAGDAGAEAAATLADRLNAADIANTIVSPLHGDDFNDDLRRGVKKADYTRAGSLTATSASAKPVAAGDDPDTPERLVADASALSNPPELHGLGELLGRLVKARLEPLPERQVLAAVKRATGISMTILGKQVGELRRRLNATGDMHRQPIRPRWAGQLRLDLAGAPERNEANVITALSNDEAFAGALVFDEFRQELLVERPLPWDKQALPLPRPWSDADDVRCAEWLQRREINVAPNVVSRSVAALGQAIRIHPVRDYLSGLTWDGTPRLDTWTLAYLGAGDTPLHRAFGALWMISAVARIFRPAAKVDHMLILEGPQGARKSSALKMLVGEEWFTDELAEIGSKDAAQQMRGVWVIEFAELDAISRPEVSRIKAFLTRTVDRYRPPYGRYVIDVPRQCVFAGSVNPETYLRDETGNRRFWPVRCGTIDLDALARDRDQLWAEAVQRYRAGAVWWLTDPELVSHAAAEQDARFQSDAWETLIERWLVFDRQRINRGYAGFDDWREEEVERVVPLDDVSVGEILRHAIGIEPGRWTKADQMRVGGYLKSRKWQRYLRRSGAFREWRYRRPEPAPE